MGPLQPGHQGPRRTLDLYRLADIPNISPIEREDPDAAEGLEPLGQQAGRGLELGLKVSESWFQGMPPPRALPPSDFQARSWYPEIVRPGERRIPTFGAGGASSRSGPTFLRRRWAPVRGRYRRHRLRCGSFRIATPGRSARRRAMPHDGSCWACSVTQVCSHSRWPAASAKASGCVGGAIVFRQQAFADQGPQPVGQYRVGDRQGWRSGCSDGTQVFVARSAGSTSSPSRPSMRPTAFVPPRASVFGNYRPMAAAADLWSRANGARLNRDPGGVGSAANPFPAVAVWQTGPSVSRAASNTRQ